MKKIIRDGFIVALSKTVGVDIDDAEEKAINEKVQNRPTAERGFMYRLRNDLAWVLVELPTIVEEEHSTAYTAEQLEQMTSTELREICAELGISGTMTKANMISLILGKQSNSL